MEMTGGQLRVLTEGHLRIEARARAAAMCGIRAAVWADEDGFEEAIAALGEMDGGGGEADARARLAAELTRREAETGRGE